MEVLMAMAVQGNSASASTGRGRSGRPDQELAGLQAAFGVSRDPRLRAELVTHYDNLARSLARRFPSRRESREDLVQVARIGLIHAVDRFDPNCNRPFVAFARPTIMGELKRHVRDHTWGMRVPRSLQERYLDVVRSADDLTQELGRAPRIPEMAARVGLNAHQVQGAIEVDSADRIQSLDQPHDDSRHCEPGEKDPDLDRVEEKADLAALVRNLPERTKQVLELRFVDELTQSEIGRRIGASQMSVSRTLAKTLARLQIIASASTTNTQPRWRPADRVGHVRRPGRHPHAGRGRHPHGGLVEKARAAEAVVGAFLFLPLSCGIQHPGSMHIAV
jgi:RNA polymerase sigma-B factor